MSGERRERQLAYSRTQALMLDETSRRAKAAKILRVLAHFRGVEGLDGQVVLDVGCSAGIQSSVLADAGGRVVGVDIDVPGLRAAHEAYGARVRFVCADAERLPLRDGSIDVAVINQIYEHVVDPFALLADVHRVLAPGGVAYLGLQNRLAPVEPHYHLPALSWLPRPLAHRYVRAAGRATHYHERPFTRPTLRRLVSRFTVWDYTPAVLADPERFAATDVVPARVPSWPALLRRAGLPLVPGFVWVAAKAAGDAASPAGASLAEGPRLVHSAAEPGAAP